MTGDQLRRIREQLDMSQEEFGDRLGLSKLTILRYENGKRDIPRAVELAVKQVQNDK